MENSKTKNKSKFGNWLKTSITARMLMVGFLTLILLIPLAYINVLISERSYRQSDVIDEINDKWGNEVMVYGPILKLPYKTYTETSKYNEKTKIYTKETHTHINNAYIFPQTLSSTIKVDSKMLNRGNFESVVYTSDLNFTGSFVPPNLVSKKIDNSDIIWDKATIVVKTTNLKGIKNELNFSINNNNYVFETNFNNKSNTGLSILDELESSYLKIKDVPIKDSINYSFKMSFNGSEKIQLIPVGKVTTMKMTSNWANPSFTGNFLPDDKTKKITKEGFEANWKILHINRAFSQQYLNGIPNLSEYAFGSKFIVLVDQYQQSERSAKYGFLVIALTFLTFFLIQTLSKINIHSFQYLMIGLALLMFYTLLVSISEHSNFLKAYLIASFSVIILITLYSKSILKNIKFTLLIAASLTALYTFIYVIIQLENYALLVGSIGLFIILATVMFVSRKIDWNND